MRKKMNRLAVILVTVIAAVSLAGCTAAAKTPTTSTRTIPVQRGNLDVTVSVDGKLDMPQAPDLHFGAPGNVLSINVREGDMVKAGTVLATLDATQQQLDIKASNNAVQSTLAILYETVPRLPKFMTTFYGPITNGLVPLYAVLDDHGNPIQVPPGIIIYDKDGKPIMGSPGGWHNDISFPSYYPTGTILDGYAWYGEDVNNVSRVMMADNCSGASQQLEIAWADLESIVMIIDDAINNPDSGLGNVAPEVNDQNYDYLEAMGADPSGAMYYIRELRKDVELIQQVQADIRKTQDLVAQQKYSEAVTQYQAVMASLEPIGKIVYLNYNKLQKRMDTDVYGKDLSLKLFSAAHDRLDAASVELGKGGLKSADLVTDLEIAQHYMMLSNAVLGVNDYVLQNGLTMQTQQDTNVKLAGNLVDLKNKNNNFINTVILAPFDGEVVAVNLKANDVLSQQDYASKDVNDIKIVDTSQLQFKGQVDEIDITKIKAGQRATITVDAVPNRTFTGKVSFISPFGTPDTNGVVRFNITVLLDPTDVPLKGLLTSTAEIAVTSVQNALVLPLTAISTAKDGSTSVTVITSDNRTEKMPVTLGLQNQVSASILTGLNEGDRVIIQESAAGAPTTRQNFGPPGGGGGPPAGGGGGRPGG